jgi:hypothetical protein
MRWGNLNRVTAAVLPLLLFDYKLYRSVKKGRDRVSGPDPARSQPKKEGGFAAGGCSQLPRHRAGCNQATPRFTRRSSRNKDIYWVRG